MYSFSSSVGGLILIVNIITARNIMRAFILISAITLAGYGLVEGIRCYQGLLESPKEVDCPTTSTKCRGSVLGYWFFFQQDFSDLRTLIFSRERSQGIGLRQRNREWQPRRVQERRPVRDREPQLFLRHWPLQQEAAGRWAGQEWSHQQHRVQPAGCHDPGDCCHPLDLRRQSKSGQCNQGSKNLKLKFKILKLQQSIELEIYHLATKYLFLFTSFLYDFPPRPIGVASEMLLS